MKSFKILILISILCIPTFLSIPFVQTQGIDQLNWGEWIVRMIGSDMDDLGYGVAVDTSGNTYIAGSTDGALPDKTSFGYYDAWVAKLDMNAELQWIEQIGTPEFDEAFAVDVDNSGNVAMVGYTGGALPDLTNEGGIDCFTLMLGKNGEQIWGKCDGTPDDEIGFGVAVTPSGNNIYVVGQTSGDLTEEENEGDYDGFASKYARDGELKWTIQFGTPGYDGAFDVAVDPLGNIYTVGFTNGAFPDQINYGGYDAWGSKYNSDGDLIWRIQLGSEQDDYARGVAVGPSGNIYMDGYTDGDFLGQINNGGYDAWGLMLDPDGEVLWGRLFGTPLNDYAYGLAIDSRENVYIGGTTNGAFSNEINYGGYDVWWRKYNPYGEEQSTFQIGTPGLDRIVDLTVGPSDNLFMVGDTTGAFPGLTNNGGHDSLIIFHNPSIDTTISSNFVVSQVMFGEPVTVSGTVKEKVSGAPVGGVTVILDYASPIGLSSQQTVITNSQGEYSSTWPYTESVGTWDVRARWEGNTDYKGASSPTISFEATKIPTTLLISPLESEVVTETTRVFSGAINPPFSGQNVTLTFTRPDGLNFTITVVTGFEGRWSYEFNTPLYGSWNLTAFFGGHSTLEDVSSSLSFDVSRGFGFGCLIATATYGSELSPQVQFLRGFRDNDVYSTFAGSSFMKVFNGFYYSFSPSVASVIADNSVLKDVMKGVLYPLIGILHVSSAAFSVFNFIPELGIVIAGFIASSLIGIMYFAPIALIISLKKKFQVPATIIRELGFVWGGSIVALVITEIFQSPAMMVATGAFVLTTICITMLTAVRILSKRLIH